MNKPRSRLFTLTGASAGKGGSVCGDSTLQVYRHTAIKKNRMMKTSELKAEARISFRLKVSLAGVLALFISQSALSEDYYWIASGWGWSKIASSAGEACDAAAREYKENQWKYIFISSWITPARTQYEKDTFGEFWCSFKWAYPDGSGPGEMTTTDPAWSPVKRYGSSCPPGHFSNDTNGSCSAGKSKGSASNSFSCPATMVGNPINFASGNKFQEETDVYGQIQFRRSYNSLDGRWRHGYSDRISWYSSSVVITRADGREISFDLEKAFSAGDIGTVLKKEDSWEYIAEDNERFTFDAAGKLIHWSNAQGVTRQLTYAGSQVTVTDNLGNSLSFTEDANQQPLTLTAPGVQITYGYNANQRLTSVTRVIDGLSTQRQFHYEDARSNTWLTGVTDERGMRYATWAYDDKGRAISSEHAGGADRMSVAYNSDGTVSVANELGKVTKYSFQAIDGLQRIARIDGEPSANCPMSNSTFTYDTRGLLKTKTDNKGFVTTYDYSERGLETTRTEASGTAQARTTSTTWHSTLNLPLTVTEPGRVTTYTYDAQGRQLSQTSASTAL